MSNRKRHEGKRDNPDPSACLGVFGLGLYTTERDLEKEFGRYGPLEKCKVVLDGKSGQVYPLKTFLNRFKLLCSREALPF